MICKNCYMEMPEGMFICPWCGTPLDSDYIGGRK
jgi:hypothetical protein